MSLSAALSGALSGLDVASKRAATVSTNVAQAGRPGYARRDVEASPVTVHAAGLRATVVRNENAAAMSLQRTAGGQAARAGVRADFWQTLDATLGDPDDANGLAAAMSAFEGALLDAETHPGSPERLSRAVDAADWMRGRIVAASEGVARKRQAAEDAIVSEVARLNRDLEAIEDLNVRIAAQHGGDGTARVTLEDQRSALLTRVSEQVAIEVLPRDFGAVAIVSKGGQILLDGNAAPVSFAPAPQVTPERSFPGGGLNGLEMHGRPVPAGDGIGNLGGGRLEALFAVRDVDAPDAQAEVDAMAATLVARFSDAAVDPTLAAGEAGLFVDGGLPGDPPEGLASRLALNAGIDPADGGTHWRIRDGLGAAAVQDPAAPPGRLTTMIAALSVRDVPVGAALGTAPRDLVGLGAELKSRWSGSLGAQAEALERANASAAAARERSAEESGVDVDAEMRRLIEIEQAYAASAKVMEVVDQMMERLQRI